MVTFHFSWGHDEVELHGHGGIALCSHGSGCRGELLTSWQQEAERWEECTEKVPGLHGSSPNSVFLEPASESSHQLEMKTSAQESLRARR